MITAFIWIHRERIGLLACNCESKDQWNLRGAISLELGAGNRIKHSPVSDFTNRRYFELPRLQLNELDLHLNSSCYQLVQVHKQVSF